jgi:hypothetical protein
VTFQPLSGNRSHGYVASVFWMSRSVSKERACSSCVSLVAEKAFSVWACWSVVCDSTVVTMSSHADWVRCLSAAGGVSSGPSHLAAWSSA